jgi:vacuolar-type H+-ATPase subunit H
MTSFVLKAHLEELERDYLEAEREIEDFQERSERRINDLNTEVRNLVERVQKEKNQFRDQLGRKKAHARKKAEEIDSFRVRSPLHLNFRQT